MVFNCVKKITFHIVDTYVLVYRTTENMYITQIMKNRETKELCEELGKCALESEQTRVERGCMTGKWIY